MLACDSVTSGSSFTHPRSICFPVWKYWRIVHWLRSVLQALRQQHPPNLVATFTTCACLYKAATATSLTTSRYPAAQFSLTHLHFFCSKVQQIQAITLSAISGALNNHRLLFQARLMSIFLFSTQLSFTYSASNQWREMKMEVFWTWLAWKGAVFLGRLVLPTENG